MSRAWSSVGCDPHRASREWLVLWLAPTRMVGAVLAAGLSPVPHSIQLFLAGVSMVLLIAYALEKDYVLQVTFTTVMLVMLISTGTTDDALEIDGLRVLYTLSASVIGGALALLLVRTDPEVPQEAVAR